MVRPYEDSFELSYTIIISYTTDSILPSLWYASGYHSGGCYAPPSVRQESSPPRLTGLWSFSIVSGPRLDGRALCRQLRVILHHHSILHHRHHPPLLGISSVITQRGCAPPQLLSILSLDKHMPDIEKLQHVKHFLSRPLAPLQSLSPSLLVHFTCTKTTVCQLFKKKRMKTGKI